MARRQFDLYETAPWQVDALVDNLPELYGRIWCPCVGDGSLERRLAQHQLTPRITNDIDTTKPANFHLDATKAESWEHMIGKYGRPDWVVDNFPFKVEIEIVKHAYYWARKGVIAMSRISFVEGTKDRGPWLAEHPRQKQIVLERYSFTGDGKSDSATTEWLVWAKVPITNPGCVTTFGYKDGSAQLRRAA